MSDLMNFLSMASKGSQDFKKKTDNGVTTVTIVTSGNADVHLRFDKDGNFTGASAS